MSAPFQLAFDLISPISQIGRSRCQIDTQTRWSCKRSGPGLIIARQVFNQRFDIPGQVVEPLPVTNVFVRIGNELSGSASLGIDDLVSTIGLVSRF